MSTHWWNEKQTLYSTSWKHPSYRVSFTNYHNLYTLCNGFFFFFAPEKYEHSSGVTCYGEKMGGCLKKLLRTGIWEKLWFYLVKHYGLWKHWSKALLWLRHCLIPLPLPIDRGPVISWRMLGWFLWLPSLWIQHQHNHTCMFTKL